MSSFSGLGLSQFTQAVAKQSLMSKNIDNCSLQQKPSIDPAQIQSLFLTKMALAVKDKNGQYKLLIGDISGQKVQPILITRSPITSLSWNKSNNSLAYVSYETGKPVIYIQNIYSAERYIVSDFSGSNSSPVFEDNSLLVSLSKDYGTHIYKIDLSKYSPRKTAIPSIKMGSIDTEADYANGNTIFTSDKNGKPQIFLEQKGSSQIRQISIGKNNLTGRISNDGTKVLYLSKSRGGYSLVYFNLALGTTKILDSGRILSATFAPNGEIISYIKNNKIVLYNLKSGSSLALANLQYREIYDARWSK